MNKELEQRIDDSERKRLAFVIKAAIIAGHISEDVIVKSLELADTLKSENWE